jgi:hypothetical protein
VTDGPTDVEQISQEVVTPWSAEAAQDHTRSVAWCKGSFIRWRGRAMLLAGGGVCALLHVPISQEFTKKAPLTGREYRVQVLRCAEIFCRPAHSLRVPGATWPPAFHAEDPHSRCGCQVQPGLPLSRGRPALSLRVPGATWPPAFHADDPHSCCGCQVRPGLPRFTWMTRTLAAGARCDLASRVSRG